MLVSIEQGAEGMHAIDEAIVATDVVGRDRAQATRR